MNINDLAILIENTDMDCRYYEEMSGFLELDADVFMRQNGDSFFEIGDYDVFQDEN